MPEHFSKGLSFNGSLAGSKVNHLVSLSTNTTMAVLPEDVSGKAIIAFVLTLPQFLVGTGSGCNRPAGF